MYLNVSDFRKCLISGANGISQAENGMILGGQNGGLFVFPQWGDTTIAGSVGTLSCMTLGVCWGAGQ